MTVVGGSYGKSTEVSGQFDLDLVTYIKTGTGFIPATQRMAMLRDAQCELVAYGASVIKRAGDRRLCFNHQGLEVDLILVENW